MVCGPDVFRLIEVADQVMQRHAMRVAPPAPAPAGQPRVDPWAEALSLYEQGLIDDAALQRLRRLAARGELRPVDVAVLRFEAQRRGATRPSSKEEEGLRLLKARRARLLNARQSSQQTLQRVEAQIADLDARIREKEEAARAVLPQDEERARQLLEEKVLFEESKARLEEQARALREDIQSLEDVLAQIEAKIVELEAMQTRAELHARRT